MEEHMTLTPHRPPLLARLRALPRAWVTLLLFLLPPVGLFALAAVPDPTGLGLPTFDPVAWGRDYFQFSAVILSVVGLVKRLADGVELRRIQAGRPLDGRLTGTLHSPFLWTGFSLAIGVGGAFALYAGGMGASLPLWGTTPPLSVLIFGLAGGATASGFRGFIKSMVEAGTGGGSAPAPAPAAPTAAAVTAQGDAELGRHPGAPAAPGAVIGYTPSGAPVVQGNPAAPTVEDEFTTYTTDTRPAPELPADVAPPPGVIQPGPNTPTPTPTAPDPGAPTADRPLQGVAGFAGLGGVLMAGAKILFPAFVEALLKAHGLDASTNNVANVARALAPVLADLTDGDLTVEWLNRGEVLGVLMVLKSEGKLT